MTSKFRTLSLEKQLFFSFLTFSALLLFLSLSITLSFNITKQRREIDKSISSIAAYITSMEQVANMLQRMFNFESIPSHLDATDALAVAVCHSYQKEDLLVSNSSVKKTSSKKSSWASFVSQNPDRVK